MRMRAYKWPIHNQYSNAISDSSHRTSIYDISCQLTVIKTLETIAAKSRNFQDVYEKMKEHPLYYAMNYLAHPLVVKCIYDICQTPGNLLRVTAHDLQFYFRMEYTRHMHINRPCEDESDYAIGAKFIEEYSARLGIPFEKVYYGYEENQEKLNQHKIICRK